MTKHKLKAKSPQVPALDHLYIPTRDFEKAWKFWAEAAGGAVTATWGESGHQAGQVTLGGLNIVVAQEDETREDSELGYRVQHGRPILFFATPNMDKLYRDLANRGASILRGPLTTHWGRRVLTVRAGETVVAFVEAKKKEGEEKMKYARLGDTGLVVSRLAFGSMTFGSGEGPMGNVWKTGQKEADALVGRCLDAGVNLFDSADMYAGGESEKILGKALGAKRAEIALCTKAGFRASPSQLRTGLSARNLIAQAEGSLKRLGTDWLDLFVVHRVDPHTPLDETLRALEDLVRSGKIRYVGYSNWPAWLAASAVARQKERGWTPFTAAQMYASLVGRDVEHETVPLLRAEGIGMMVWSPLAGGFLSGRYTRKDPTGGAGRLKDFDFLPTDKEKGWVLIDAMAKIAKNRGFSVASVALAWLLSKDWATTILVGASKMSQLDDNLKAADLELSKDEVAALDAVTAPAPMYPNWFNDKTADAATRQALGV